MCKYDPQAHFNHKKPMTTTDQKYLIELYGKIPISELRLSLGRTYKAIAEMASSLRKQGKIKGKGGI